MKRRKIIKRILVTLFWTAIIIGVCIFPYRILFMGHSIPQQPELSLIEKRYFNKLKREQPWSEIDRMYFNLDSLGRSIWIRDIPIDFSSPYRYTIKFITNDTAFYYANSTFQKAVCFGKYIKDSVCVNSPYLSKMIIIIAYEDTIKNSRNGMLQYYEFLSQNDSLYLVPDTELNY